VARNGPRLPLVPPQEADASQREVAAAIMAARGRAGSPLLAAFGPLLHSPDAARSVAALGEYCRFGSRLPDDVREAAILAVAAALGAEYERSHHEPLARWAGLGDAALDALRGGRNDAPPLSAAQSMAAQMGREVALGGGDTEEIFDACRARLGDAATVDLVVTAAYYGMIAALQRVLDITVADDPA
jgi:4-carboxymuconolactone decarboxylase